MKSVNGWRMKDFRTRLSVPSEVRKHANVYLAVANLSRVWTSKSYVTFVHDLIQKLIWTALLLPFD